MKNFLVKKRTVSLVKSLFFLLLLSFCIVFASCNKKVDYLNYVSELRSNILLAETDGFSLRVYAVSKESPYAMDGIPQERSTRVEIYLIAPEGDENCNLTFSYEGKEYGGEMSFDNVKTEYYFSCTLDACKATELPCRIEYGEQVVTLQARSVHTADTLTPENALQNLVTEESALFDSLTDKYGFAGEIYIRLIYEDSPYYYVGIIDRNGNINAFLINAKTGKILAKRTS